MIRVGQKVQFDPFDETTGFASRRNAGKTLTGTVVAINEPHQWFSVEYYVDYIGGKVKQRTSFKFYQIGKWVKICGE